MYVYVFLKQFNSKQSLPCPYMPLSSDMEVNVGLVVPLVLPSPLPNNPALIQ